MQGIMKLIANIATRVSGSKSANIPSAEYLYELPCSYKPESKEIQKIYAAIDYDPETGEYGEKHNP